MYKTRIKARDDRNIPLHHIQLSHQLTIKHLNLKVDHHTGGNGVHPRPQTTPGESVVHLLIVLSIVCKFHTEEV